MKFDPKKFKYLEFCPGKFHTEWIITWDELVKERDKKEYHGNEMFISRYAFDRENLEFGPILSNLYFDFDCKENLNRARHETVDCVEFFSIRYGIPANTLKIRFTGGKGFSVEIPFQYFDLEPNEYLYLIWKEIAEQCKRMRKWKTMDTSVYNRTRLWRLTNSRHASGYYKIPLSYDELKEMKIEKIKNMALNPRGYAGPHGYGSDMEREYAPVFDLAKWYDETESTVKKRIRKMEKTMREQLGKDIPAKFDESKIWYCVAERIKQGVKLEDGEFRREPTAFNIACTLQRLGASKEYIKGKLVEFAKNCEPEFPEERYFELDHAIEMAFRYKYKMHCLTPCFAALCDKNKCWMHQEVAIQRESYSEDVIKEANEVLKSPENVKYVEKALADVIGEQKTKIFLFFLQLIRESAELSGETSTGKNQTMDAIMNCFPRHTWFKITGSSAKAVRYLGDEVHTLYLAERRATRDKLSEESLAEYDVKLAISEEKLCVIVVEKGKDGKMHTVKIETSLENVQSTSTEVKISNELQNRIWEESTDESRKQNIAVRDGTLNESAELKEDRTSCEHEKQILRAANEIIEKEAPTNFVIPYAPQLKALLNPNQSRVRRDTKKLLKAIQAFAKFNYKNRPIIESPKEKQLHIICMPQDFYYAWEYGQSWIIGTFSGKTKRYMKALEQAREIVKAGKVLDGNTLAYMLGIGYIAGRNWLNRFSDDGVLIKEKISGKKRGRPAYRYRLPAKSESEFIEIKFSDLFTATEKWFKKHGIKELNYFGKGSFEKWKSKILKTEIPSTFIPKIEDLPVSPELEEEVDKEDVRPQKEKW